MTNTILPGVQRGRHKGQQQGRLQEHLAVQEMGRPQAQGRHLVQLVQDNQVQLGQGRPLEVPGLGNPQEGLPLGVTPGQGRGRVVPGQGRPQDRMLPGSLLPQQAGFPMDQAILEGLGFQTQIRHH